MYDTRLSVSSPFETPQFRSKNLPVVAPLSVDDHVFRRQNLPVACLLGGRSCKFILDAATACTSRSALMLAGNGWASAEVELGVAVSRGAAIVRKECAVLTVKRVSVRQVKRSSQQPGTQVLPGIELQAPPCKYNNGRSMKPREKRVTTVCWCHGRCEECLHLVWCRRCKDGVRRRNA